MKDKCGVCSCRWLVVVLAMLVSAAGCASSESPSGRRSWEGPQAAIKTSTEPWSFHNLPGITVHTPHYAIHSTILDTQYLNRLAQVMEGALLQYEKQCPQVRTRVTITWSPAFRRSTFAPTSVTTPATSCP